MQPTDITRLVTLGPPTLSPDGRRAVVAATRADLDADDYRSALWIVATDGSTPPRQLTQGPHDSAPAWSPDGTQLAFLRAQGDDGKPQVHLLPTDGGDARALTDLHLGAGAPRWSPDSTRIAFTARVPEPRRYGQEKKVTPDKEPPRRVTRFGYRMDGAGFVLDRPEHVFVLDVTVDDPTPTQVTDGDQDDSGVAWSPDGGQLAFVSARHEGRDLDRAADLVVVSPDGSGLRIVSDTTLWFDAPVWTADGTALVAQAEDPTGSGWITCNLGLFRVDVTDAPSTPVRLTDRESVHLTGGPPVVDGDDVLVLMENRGAVELRSVPLTASGATGTVLGDGPRQYGAVACAGGVTVATYSDATTAGELARIDDGTAVTLTAFAADGPSLVTLQELDGNAPDGYPVHGWLTVPTGEGPHPVLLMIHGGPFAQYGWTLLDEAQVYADAGYAVVFGNPRGSSGYGEAHGRYIVGDVGERQAPDLFALLDVALRRPELDASRVGVLGGSHGGFMTTWLAGTTDRFRAAVSERAVNAIDSFEGSSDIGWDFADGLYGTDPEQRRRQSPFTYADGITAPLLIIHSEQDWRCPLEQAQRLYVSLRKRRATVEMLIFPGEGHELSRSGLPSHRVARFEAIVDWFDRYLR